MTDDADGGDGQSTRRKLLKGIGGIGIGAGIGVGGVAVLADRTDHVDLEDVAELRPSQERAPATEPDENPAPRTTPWDQDTVVFSIVRDDSLRGFDYVPEQLAEAATFWNDYIAANEPFDLTLSFEPDHADPDVRFHEHSLMDCYGEYESPATHDSDLTAQVCVETLRETPDGTPITADIGTVAGGHDMYRITAQHALGRLVGYDVWSDPVHVMNPKILIGPSHALHPDATARLGTPSRGAGNRENFAQSVEEHALSSIRDAETEHLDSVILSAHEDMQWFLDEHEDAMSLWTTRNEELGVPRYTDAYEATVQSGEIAFLDETLTTMTDLVENNTNEEIQGSEELEALENRLETIVDWPETNEAWDVQIHRHYTDAVWAEWTSE